MSTNTLTAKRGKKDVKALCILFLVICSFTSSLVARQTRNGTPDKGSTFTAQLVNIEAPVHEVFRYSTTLHNGTSQPHVYELTAGIPDGWSVVFRARGYQLTSINMDGNKDESISIEIQPAYNAKPTKYKIPITAVALSDTVKLDLEARGLIKIVSPVYHKKTFHIKLTRPGIQQIKNSRLYNKISS